MENFKWHFSWSTQDEDDWATGYSMPTLLAMLRVAALRGWKIHGGYWE